MRINPDYPPKNRVSETLHFLEQRIIHAGGTEVFNPNSIVGAAVTRTEWLLSLEPVPGRTSVLSGEPAVIYRIEDLEIPLTTRELFRIIARDLKPWEFLKLRETYGEFHEIHDDFYDPLTGMAEQPLYDRAGDDRLRID